MLRRVKVISHRGHVPRTISILAILLTMAVITTTLPVNAMESVGILEGSRELAELASLADILKVAMENSPSLKIAKMEQEEALAGKRQVSAALKPQLTIAGQHRVENAVNSPNLTIGPIGAGVMDPDDRLNTTIGSLTWYQQLGPNAQLKGALGQAEVGTDIALLRQEQALKELVVAIEAGYHGVLRAYNGLALAREAQEHARLNVVAEEARQSLGTATPLDVLKEKNTYLEAQQAAQAAEMGVEMAVLALLQTMGQETVDTDTALGWAKQLATSHQMMVQPWEVDVSAAFQYMTLHRSELAMARKQATMAEIALNQVKGERDWTVKLSGQYAPDEKTMVQSSVDSNQTWVSTVVRTEPPKLPEIPPGSAGGMGGAMDYTSIMEGIDVDPWQVDLNVSYRFGDGGAKKAQIVAKEAALEKARLQVAMAEDGFYLELNGAIQQLNQLWRGYLLALEGEQAARETLAQLELMYELGSVTNKEVREGQLMVAQASNKVLDAGLRYEAQKSKVAATIGVDGQILIQAITRNQWENPMADWGAGESEE